VMDNFRRQWYRVHWRSELFPGDRINYFNEGLTGIRTSKLWIWWTLAAMLTEGQDGRHGEGY
jgi:hypothetical protein